MYSFINKQLKNYMGIIFASIFMLSIITIPQSASADEINQNEQTEIEVTNNQDLMMGNGEQIRFSIGELYAPDEGFEGTLSVKLGDKSGEAEISSTSSEKLGGSIIFPVSSGDYDVSLFDNDGSLIFKINGKINKSDDNYVHQRGQIISLTGGITSMPDKKAFNIEMGYVTGSMLLEVETLGISPDKCEINAALDSNADGIFQNDERFSTKLTEIYTLFEGPKIEELPLESKYESNVICNGMKVASNFGSYDLLGGEAMETKKSRSSENIKVFSVGFKRTPYVTVASISGETLSPPNEKLQPLPKDTLESWDLNGNSNSRGLNKTEANTEIEEVKDPSNYSIDTVFNWFTDHPWTYLPASLVLAIVVIGCFATIAIVSQRKNSHRL